MHQALYRKYRPQFFSDVSGQKHITDILSYQAEEGKLSHAYLFCGSRGTGKTTCAKILAKAVNCERPKNGGPCGECESCLEIDRGLATDVIEMDAASNNSVEDIRRLCEEVVYSPAMLKKKVYIIDEVHMLSQGAFNALLKTIEEPPAHVLFILATTELNKIPQTIVSRCQRFDFRRIDMDAIADRLEYIAENEGVTLSRDAALLLARQAQGGMRDAIGLFELCSASGEAVDGDKVRDVLGLSGYELLSSVMENVRRGNAAGLFSQIAELSSSSKDLFVFWQELISFVRDMLVSKYAENAKSYLDLTDNEEKILKAIGEKFNLSELIYYSKVLDEGSSLMQKTPQNKRITAEIYLLRMTKPELDSSADALNARIAALEDKISLLSLGEGARLEAPKIKEEKKKDEAKIEEKPVENGNGSVEMIAVRDFSEVVARMENINRGVAQFLREAYVKVSADGKKLFIYTDGFGPVVMGSAEAKESLGEAFAVAKITDGRAEITILKKGTEKKDGSLSDELSNLL